MQAWFDGDLLDELTDAEILWLEKRVFKAVAAKMLARPDVHTFGQHKTPQ